MTLEIDNVELYFKEKRILNGIYLKAETGIVTGILGSNGRGKKLAFKHHFWSTKTQTNLLGLMVNLF